MKTVVLIIAIVLPSPALAQTAAAEWDTHNSPTSETLVTDPRPNPSSDAETVLNSLAPHPYVSFGPLLGGGGYRPLALRGEVGFNTESRHWVMDGLAAYDNDRKTDDGDQPNPKGHDRFLNGGIYFRPSEFPAKFAFLGDANRWFFGAGYSWSQLSTTNYVKGGNRPEIGGGYDVATRSCSRCRRDFSMRVGFDWVMAGNDWQNGSHGAQVTVTFPGPRENRHWFLRQRTGVYRFHETVTEPTNLLLTHQQLSNKSTDSTTDWGVIYRF